MAGKPRSKKNTYILICYEEGRGGETQVGQQLAGEFTKLPKLHVKSVKGPTLKKSGSLAILWWHFASFLFWTKTIIQQRHIEVIYTTTYAIGVPTAALKRLYNFKLVYHHHGLRIPEKPSWSSVKNTKIYMTQRLKYAVIGYLHTLFFNMVDIVLVPSQYTKGQLLSLFPNLSQKAIYIVDNGINTKKFFPKGKKLQLKLRQKLGISKKENVVLYVGSLHARKRVDGIMRIFSRLATNSHYRLLIAHPNSKDEESTNNLRLLKKLASRLDINSNILWLKNPKNLNNIYNTSDITILFSREEHFPLVALEALATGSLFVATPVGNLKSLLTSIDKRLILSANIETATNQIKTVLGLSELTKATIRKRGYKLIKSYRWEKLAKNLLTIVKKGLKTGN